VIRCDSLRRNSWRPHSKPRPTLAPAMSTVLPEGRCVRPRFRSGAELVIDERGVEVSRLTTAQSGSGVSATSWRTRGAARRCSTSCRVPTLDKRLPRWRRAGIARTRRRKWWRRARRRRRGWSVRSSDPRTPRAFFLYFPWCLVLWCLVVVLACVLFPFVLCAAIGQMRD